MRVVVKRLLTIAVVISIFVLIFVTFILLVTFLGDRDPATRKRAVASPPPDMFPIVVIARDGSDAAPEPHLVYQKNLADFLAKHPDSAFLVPEALDESLNTRLKARSAEDNPGDEWYGRVTVRRIARDRQELEVYGTSGDDYRNASSYEARATQIVPHSHLFYFGPGVGMNGCAPALAITLAVWAIVLVTFWYVWKKRRR